MAEKPDFDKIFANKATSVHEWEKDNYDTGWGFLGETPPPYELFDALQRENDNKTKYLSKRTEDINTDLTQDINNLQSDLNNKYNELKTGLGSTNTALQQHNTDENAHSNLLQRALVTEAKTAPNTADWNTLTESRTYKITGATFAADKHQPVGATGTGELVVLKNGDDTIAQVYYAKSSEFDKAGAYHRINIGGAWTDWVYNITNKGGTIENNLQINGKLVVPNVYVTEKLLIGDYDPSKPEQPDLSNFLTPDDLQKLQDQIIVPEQEFFVDQKNGDDSNDGKTKPFRTLSKVFSVLRPNIPTVIVNLETYIEPENEIYNTFILENMIENDNLKIGNLIIRATWKSFEKNRIVAKIIVPYGKVNTGQTNNNTTPPTLYYQWGRFFMHGCKGCTLQSVIFQFPTDTADSSKFRNAVFYAFEGNFKMNNFSGNTMNLPDNCSFFLLPNSSNIDTIYFEESMFEGSNIQGNDLLFKGSLSNIYPNNPRDDTSNGKKGSALTSTISKLINLNVNFGSNVLGSTSGLDSNVYAVYKRGKGFVSN